ncbi:Small G protein signaling modulator 2 [Trichinella pseudospiralis]|uniref:Small G protein signaling modulator 2 n=1 Tax=Trichinella pseudospiralis TaxID=6337 RepID=A0A0V1KB83_TRIPS|nr:Small G protein signaling modulator 2 [Trichinella pseudospiralis]
MSDQREALLMELKKQVKHIVEEAVLKKVISESDSCLLSLCLAVEHCLLHGLRKRVFGLFGRATTFALLHKIAVSFPPAERIFRKAVCLEKLSLTRKRHQSVLVQHEIAWIRLAITEKVLDIIIKYISENAKKYYDENALMRDSVSSSMVAGLLVGICALEYTKLEVSKDDTLELNICSALFQQQDSYSDFYKKGITSPKPTLEVKRTSSFGADILNSCPLSLRDYFISLRQSSKVQFLYGKNNISVQHGVTTSDYSKGYLSIQLIDNSALYVKWIPNELMQERDVSVNRNLWQSVISFDMAEINSVHCHINRNNSFCVLFVRNDGVPYSLIQFEAAQNMIDFLSVINSAIQPERRLESSPLLQAGGDDILKLMSNKSTGEKEQQCRTSVELEKQLRSKEYVLMIVDTAADTYEIPDLAEEEEEEEEDEDETENCECAESCQSKSSDNVKADQNEINLIEKDQTRNCVQSAYDSMKHQILCRAFYGLAFCRHMKTLRIDLSSIIKKSSILLDNENNNQYNLLSEDEWINFKQNRNESNENEFLMQVFFAGCDPSIRKEVWLYILEIYNWNKSDRENEIKIANLKCQYQDLLTQWTAVESIVREKDKEMLELTRKFNKNKLSSYSEIPLVYSEFSLSNEVFTESLEESGNLQPSSQKSESPVVWLKNTTTSVATQSKKTSTDEESGYLGSGDSSKAFTFDHPLPESPPSSQVEDALAAKAEEPEIHYYYYYYSKNLIDLFALNFHRIEKDVRRCDRNYPYFNEANLEKLKNVLCSYVWQHLEDGYVQGMCDLAAPLLVAYDDEFLTYCCFTKLMQRMGDFFHGFDQAMDSCLSYVSKLLQVMDQELFEMMRLNDDFTHCYFCYRWFLLDFKREFAYEHTFKVWEVIWTGNRLFTSNFSIFVALALIETHRDVLIKNSMDFPGKTKIFNFKITFSAATDMAGQHNASVVLNIARKLITRLETLLYT